MIKSKKDSRIRRAKRTKMAQRRLGALRLVIHRTPRHIYAQVIKSGSVIADTFDSVLLTVSSLDPEIKSQLKSTGNVESAKMVGATLAKKAVEKGIEDVSFDRAGFRYHGRVKALADAARENGLRI